MNTTPDRIALGALLAAVLLAAACDPKLKGFDDIEDEFPVTGSTDCASDADCGEGEVCRVADGVCEQSTPTDQKCEATYCFLPEQEGTWQCGCCKDTGSDERCVCVSDPCDAACTGEAEFVSKCAAQQGGDDDTGDDDDAGPPPILGCKDASGNDLGCHDQSGAIVPFCAPEAADECECDKIDLALPFAGGKWQGQADLKAVSPIVDRTLEGRTVKLKLIVPIADNTTAVNAGTAIVDGILCLADKQDEPGQQFDRLETVTKDGTFRATIAGLLVPQDFDPALSEDAFADVVIDAQFAGPECLVGWARIFLVGGGVLGCPLAAELEGPFFAERVEANVADETQWPLCLRRADAKGAGCPQSTTFQKEQTDLGIPLPECQGFCSL